MVDNFNLISKLLKFEQPTDFYYIEVTKRKKENPDFKKSSKIVSRYLISDVSRLADLKDEIIDDCNYHNARAYIRLNKRNIHKVTLRSAQLILKYIEEGQYGAAKDAFWKAAGDMHDEGKNKTWIVDIDVKDEEHIREVQSVINRCEPIGSKIIANIETKNGVHLITKAFNITRFDMLLFNNKIDIHKDNPTILYVP